MRLLTLRPGTDGKVRRRSRDERKRTVESRLPQIAVDDPAAIFRAVPRDRSPPHLRAVSLRFDARDVRVWELPRHHQQHAPEPAPEIEKSRRAANVLRSNVRRDQIIETPAMPALLLKQPPFTREEAEIFVFSGN
jgi:hypothetical protein